MCSTFLFQTLHICKKPLSDSAIMDQHNAIWEHCFSSSALHNPNCEHCSLLSVQHIVHYVNTLHIIFYPSQRILC